MDQGRTLGQGPLLVWDVGEHGGEDRTCGTAGRECGQNPRELQHELLEPARAVSAVAGAV